MQTEKAPAGRGIPQALRQSSPHPRCDEKPAGVAGGPDVAVRACGALGADYVESDGEVLLLVRAGSSEGIHHRKPPFEDTPVFEILGVKRITPDVQKLVNDLGAYGRLSFENGFRPLDLCDILAERVDADICINEDRHGRMTRPG